MTILKCSFTWFWDANVTIILESARWHLSLERPDHPAQAAVKSVAWRNGMGNSVEQWMENPDLMVFMECYRIFIEQNAGTIDNNRDYMGCLREFMGFNPCWFMILLGFNGDLAGIAVDNG